MNWVNQINKTLEPYYALLITLGFFGTGLIGIYNYIISPTDLKVNVQNEEVTYPSSIGNNYEKVYDYVQKNNKELGIQNISVYNFLILTTEMKTITISNISDKTLRGIQFKHLNTDAITAYSINSDYFNNEEEKKLYDNLMYDDKRGLTYLKQLIEIPPKKSITIRLWGSFKKSLLDNNLLISYENGEAYFEKSYTIEGVKGYFVEYAFEFVFLLVVLFIIIYHYGLKYAIKNNI